MPQPSAKPRMPASATPDKKPVVQNKPQPTPQPQQPPQGTPQQFAHPLMWPHNPNMGHPRLPWPHNINDPNFQHLIRASLQMGQQVQQAQVQQKVPPPPQNNPLNPQNNPQNPQNNQQQVATQQRFQPQQQGNTQKSA